MNQSLTFTPGTEGEFRYRLERAERALDAPATRARLAELLLGVRDPRLHRIIGELVLTFNSLDCLLSKEAGDVE